MEVVLGLAACAPEETTSVLETGWSAGITCIEADVRLPHVAVALTQWIARSGNAPAVVAKVKPAAGNPIGLDSDGLGRVRALADRLQLEVALVKDPPVAMVSDGTVMHLLQELAEETGAARVGFSTHELDVCATAPPSAFAPDSVVEVGVSALRPALGRHVLMSLRQAGWEPWINQPLALGVLTGDRSLDRLGATSTIEPALMSRLNAIAGSITSRLASLAAVPGVLAPETVAIGFALAQPGVGRVVLDPRDARELRRCLDARELVAVDSTFRDRAGCFGERSGSRRDLRT